MTDTPPPPSLNEYYCQMDGLTFTFRVYQLPDGSFEGKITVFEGSADFNAIYFGDGTDDGDSASLGGALNMNGGSDTDWDQAVQLSRPGLGSAGTDKPTYLSEGESFTFPLDIESLDEIAEVGIRATSTSTDAGSIKCELTPINEEDDGHDEDDNHDDEDAVKSDEADEGDAAAANDIDTIPAEEDSETQTSGDLDDAAFYEQFAALIGEAPEEADVPQDEETDEPLLV